MKTRNLHKQDFCMYFWKLKELYELGKTYKFGQGICLTEVFTEKLCRYLYNLDEHNQREFDAMEDGKNIEIKATMSKSGTTTFNPNSIFDFMYWMHFDMDRSLVNVYKISGEEFFGNPKFKEIISRQTNRERVNISLCHFFSEDKLIEIIKFKKYIKTRE